jgi:hypothetical protein
VNCFLKKVYLTQFEKRDSLILAEQKRKRRRKRRRRKKRKSTVKKLPPTVYKHRLVLLRLRD